MATPAIARLHEAVEALSRFTGGQLTRQIADFEQRFAGATADRLQNLLESVKVSNDLYSSAHLLKSIAGQINVVIHALGILLALPRILRSDERVEYLSLGAGNTGRAFDLETNFRVAEFKFIDWQGGAEVIRQNALFKDFYLLAEHDTDKLRFMYVVDTQFPLQFLNGGRSLASVMSRNRKLWESFQSRYGRRFQRVRDYYSYRKETVAVVDLRDFLAHPRSAGPRAVEPVAGRRRKSASQRDAMSSIWKNARGNHDVAIAAYAAAERAGQVQRSRNNSGLSPEQYAERLIRDGLAKGWLT